jgi:MoaA/NifB/PqqE/SkfB family radical SAM enzyme
MDLTQEQSNKLQQITLNPNNEKNPLLLQLSYELDLLRQGRNDYGIYKNLANLFVKLNYPGEAYSAINMIPRGIFNDVDSIRNLLENPPLANLNVNFEVISTCNLRCPMCSNGGNIGKPYDQHGKVMPLANFRKIWDKIKDKIRLLILVGQGETFTHPKIYDILDYVYPTPVYIDTNGNVNLNEYKIVNSSISDLIFSLDGCDQRTYGKYRVNGKFDKVINNIKNVVRVKKEKGKGPKIIIKHIVFKHTEAYLVDMQQLAKDLEVDKLEITECVVHPAHSRELIKEFLPVGKYSQLGRIKYVDFDNYTLGLNDRVDSPYCFAPINNPQIKVNGDVTLCCTSQDVVGNILKNSLENIWTSDIYSEKRKQVLTNRYKVKNCLVCSRIQNHFGDMLDGTPLAYPKPPAPSENTLWIKDLKIEPQYIQYLKDNSLSKDIGYYIGYNILNQIKPV